MAWVAVDNFDSYSDGDLNGNNGGSGWAGAWAADTDFDVQGTVTYGSSAKAITVNTLQDGEQAIRELTTGSESGISYTLMRRTTTNDNADWRIVLQKGTTAGSDFCAIVGMGSNQTTPGYFHLVHSAGYTVVNLDAYVADRWYVVAIAYECGSGAFMGLSADYFMVRIYDTVTQTWGDWSTSYPFHAAATSITHFNLLANGTGTDDVYADLITGTNPIPEASTFIPKILMF